MRFAAQLKEALGARGRHVLPPGSGRPAAVVLALFDGGGSATLPSDLHVWLLRRPVSMRTHAGEIAFPGGKRDASDASLLDTALRECEEEIGLPRSRLEVLGTMDDVLTVTGFVITPYVAWLDGPFDPVPSPHEVARVFSAPLGAFADGQSGLFANAPVLVAGETVWGATATIARALAVITHATASHASYADG